MSVNLPCHPLGLLVLRKEKDFISFEILILHTLLFRRQQNILLKGLKFTTYSESSCRCLQNEF